MWESILGNSSQEEKNCKIYNDEIDLIDLCLILWKRKTLILIGFIAFIAIGSLFVFVRKDKFEYTTTLEIGTTIKNQETQDIGLIEPLASIVEKAKVAYIPQSYDEKTRVKILCSSPKDSDLVLLKSSGFNGDINHAKQHKLVVDKILEDHDKAGRGAKSKINSRILRLEYDLEKMQSDDLFAIKCCVFTENYSDRKNVLWKNEKRTKKDIFNKI